MRFGNYEVSLVRDGFYRLDGGAMFGVVPRVLWSRPHPPDDQNRVTLALNCLLLRSEDRLVLIDNGMGDGWSQKDRKIYGLERPEGDVFADLARQGVAPEDITDVVLTHLHFDHAGSTVLVEGDSPRLGFPRATHHLQQTNLRWAENPTERDQRSYAREKWALLFEEHSDQVRLLDGEEEILPGLQAVIVNGHTPGQQLVLVGEEKGPRLLYAGDLLPFASHLRVPWIMAFDLNPLLTLQEKHDLLPRAASEGWVIVFEHDGETPAATVHRDGDHVVIHEQVTL